jgi:hypothetical protein
VVAIVNFMVARRWLQILVGVSLCLANLDVFPALKKVLAVNKGVLVLIVSLAALANLPCAEKPVGSLFYAKNTNDSSS